MDEVLGTLAANREWGLIILLVAVAFLLARSMLSTVTKSMQDRDRINGEREERLIRVMVGFGETIPKLSHAIDDLRNWLGERFDDIDEDLDYIRHDQAVLSARVKDHEGRIWRLERSADDEDGAVSTGSTGGQDSAPGREPRPDMAEEKE